MQNYNSMLKNSIRNCSDLNEICEVVRLNIQNAKKDVGDLRIVYVAGKVTADGETKILFNLKRLSLYTKQLRRKFRFVFSSADVFDQETYWKLNLAKPLHEESFYKFWRKILRSGVTDIYMTPEWEMSTGATDEYNTAKKIGLNIHFFKK